MKFKFEIEDSSFTTIRIERIDQVLQHNCLEPNVADANVRLTIKQVQNMKSLDSHVVRTLRNVKVKFLQVTNKHRAIVCITNDFLFNSKCT